MFLDTNIFIAYLKDKDEFQEEAEKLLAQIHDGTVEGEASSMSLLEICYVLKKIGKNEKEISDITHTMLSIDHLRFLPITSDIFREAIDLVQNYKLSVSDAIIAATGMKLKVAEIISEDTDFDKLPENLIKRVSIKEAVKRK